MNVVFHKWDEASDKVRQFRLPPRRADIIKSLPPSIILDLADLWHNSKSGVDTGHSRSNITLSNGTTLLTALYGCEGDERKYVVAWHPDNQTVSQDTVKAYSMAWRDDIDSDTDDVIAERDRLFNLIKEIKQKCKNDKAR